MVPCGTPCENQSRIKYFVDVLNSLDNNCTGRNNNNKKNSTTVHIRFLEVVLLLYIDIVRKKMKKYI